MSVRLCECMSLDLSVYGCLSLCVSFVCFCLSVCVCLFLCFCVKQNVYTDRHSMCSIFIGFIFGSEIIKKNNKMAVRDWDNSSICGGPLDN